MARSSLPPAVSVAQVGMPSSEPRREALKAGVRSLINTSTLGAAAVGAAPFMFSRRAAGAAFLNDPGDASSVTLGFNFAQSGTHVEEGADQLRAGRLAVRHLNGEGDGGMLATLRPSALSGQGILGKKVAYVIGDTQTGPDAALKSTRRMLDKQGVIMVTGGSTSAEALAMQQLCQEAGAIFMAGVAHGNGLTGRDRCANGFRHFLNAHLSAAALIPVLAARHGHQRTVYHLTADNAWGEELEASMQVMIDQTGWRTAGRLVTPTGSDDLGSYLEPLMRSGADTLMVNHYDDDIVVALKAIAEAGLRERKINGGELVVAIPLYSRHIARAAGNAHAGVYGTANWHWSLTDAGSQAFVASFGAEHGFPPTQAAHACYVQTLLYADACERAGTFEPCQVVAALEGHRFDGLGNGPTQYRAEDHQCFKEVLVVRGRRGQARTDDPLDIVEVIPRSRTDYPVDHRLFAGSAFAQCNNGA